MRFTGLSPGLSIGPAMMPITSTIITGSKGPTHSTWYTDAGPRRGDSVCATVRANPGRLEKLCYVRSASDGTC